MDTDPAYWSTQDEMERRKLLGKIAQLDGRRNKRLAKLGELLCRCGIIPTPWTPNGLPAPAAPPSAAPKSQSELAAEAMVRNAREFLQLLTPFDPDPSGD